MSNDLEAYFRQHEGPMIHKWHHYFEIYDRHFSSYRGQDITLVEFGVSQGGSLKMWRSYFGPKAKIIGVDINPQCKQFEKDGIRIFIGDQGDRDFLKDIARQIPRIDILIDDGGHAMHHQICTFEELFPCVPAGGVYLIEDLHTSYWRGFGGGYRRKGTFIEYSKNFIDYINAWYTKQPRRFNISDFTRTVHSLHYYDSILVVEKRAMEPPKDEYKGERLFADFDVLTPRLLDRISRRIRGR